MNRDFSVLLVNFAANELKIVGLLISEMTMILLQKKIKIIGVVSDNGKNVKNSTLLVEK